MVVMCGVGVRSVEAPVPVARHPKGVNVCFRRRSCCIGNCSYGSELSNYRYIPGCFSCAGVVAEICRLESRHFVQTVRQIGSV